MHKSQSSPIKSSNPTQQSTSNTLYSQEKQIYYYSSFSLFENQKHQNTFYQYSLFMQKVSNQLGIQWKTQANKLFSPYASSRQVFMNLLQIWLHHHPITNNFNNNFNNNKKISQKFTFNQSYVEQFIQRMKSDIERKNISKNYNVDVNNNNNEIKNNTISTKNIKIQTVSVKAVCIGFFMTSNQIWEQMFQSNLNPNNNNNNNINYNININNNNNSSNSNNNIFTTSSSLISQKDQKNFFTDNPFIQGVTKTIQKTFKPVMIVSQKISNVFGKKKIKINENIKMQQQNQSNINTNNNNDNSHNKFQDCFQQFQKTLDIERQVQRKLSEINLNEFQQYNLSSQKLITSKLFTQNQSPFQNNIMSSVYDYLTNFLKINTPWQVANTFVTNILQMNNLKTQQGTQVKVLKPAEDFYQKLVFVWILLQNQNHQTNNHKQTKQIKFQQYLHAVKTKFNKQWQQKYIIPTKYFFQRINKDWSEIKSQTIYNNNNNNNLKNQSNITINNKEILCSLLKRIRNGMKNQWDRKIKLTTKRNWKSEESIGKSSEFYQNQTFKRQRNFRDY